MGEFQSESFGKYQLVKKIATGGMAEVYLAKIYGDEGFEKPIVIKKVLPHLLNKKDSINLFIGEAKLAAFLHHENIIQTYDFGRMDNDYFIAMEFLFGKNLRLILKKSEAKGIFPPLEVILYIVSKMCKGLAYAHNLRDFTGKQLNIIHQDISPPNIYVTYQGEVKILDFGIAKANALKSKFQAGSVQGKVQYMSPEQAKGQFIDHRLDIFAVGAIFYEMLTGLPLYDGEIYQVFTMAQTGDFINAREIKKIPDVLCDILDKSLAVDLEDRYPTCEEMGYEIEDAIFKLKLRPTDRNLREYIQQLFEEDIEKEENQFRLLFYAKNSEYDSSNIQTNIGIQQTAASIEQTIDVEVIDSTIALNTSEVEGHHVQLKKDITPRIYIFGSTYVGKTSLLIRLKYCQFYGNYLHLAGAYAVIKKIQTGDKQIRLNMWEHSGIDKYNPFSASAFEKMAGYIMVADSSRPWTVEVATLVRAEIEATIGILPSILIVNKCDMTRDTGAIQKALYPLLQDKWSVHQVSAKTGAGVQDAFNEIAEKINNKL